MTHPEPIHPTTAAVLAAIEAFWAEHGYSPSFREIGLVVQRPTSVVARHVVYLRNAGYLTYQDGKARTIVLRRRA